MAKSKTKTYRLYDCLIDDVVTYIRKGAPKSVKRKPPEKILKDYFDLVPAMANSLVFPTMSEEYFWKKRSGTVLVPEDDVILSHLYRAKFDIDHARHVIFPHQSFMIAIPNGTVIDDVELPPVLVTWHPFSTHSEKVFEPFGKWIGYPMGHGTPNLPADYDPDLPAITLAFKDEDSKSAHTKIVAHCEHLPKILNAKNPAEILDVVGMFDNTNYEMVMRPSDKELKIQAILLKIVVALGVYYSATKDQGTLERGMPDTKARFNRPKQPFVRPFSLRSLSHKKDREIVGEEYGETSRTWHFRQLRHPRYYKGQYENWPLGSRIVFVSDAIVRYKKTIYADSKDGDMV